MKYFKHKSSFIDVDVEIGDDTKIWYFSHIQYGARIGKGCTLGQNVNIGVNVKIGDYCKIQNNVSVYEGVEFEDYVFCGPSVVFTNVLSPRCEYPASILDYKKTLIKKHVTIGANATILPGITIHEYAFIAAGAVVTKEVPAYALMIGIPAKHIGYVDKRGDNFKYYDK